MLSFLQAKGANGAPRKSNTKQQTSTSPSEPKVSPGNKRPSGGGRTKGERGGKKAKKTEIKEEQEEKTTASGGQRPKNSKRRSIASKISYKEESNSEGENDEGGLSDEEEFKMSSEEEDSAESEHEAKSTKKGKRRGKADETISKSRAAQKRKSGGGKQRVKEEEQDSEENEEDCEVGEGTPSNVTKSGSGKKKAGPGEDEWLEVYLEKTSSWVCVDVEHGVDLPHLCSQNATAPVTYVLSVDGDGFVKDLGRKYDPTWMTSSRKRRVDDEWWEETLEPFLGPEDERDRKEDKEVTSSSVQYYVLYVFKLKKFPSASKQLPVSTH